MMKIMSSSYESEPDQSIAGKAPVAVVISWLAREAALLSTDAAYLDAEISRLVAMPHAVDGHVAQKADALRQALEGLQEFLEALSKSVEPQTECLPGQAAQGLKLRDQAQRLGEGCSAPSAHDNPHELWDSM